MTILLGAVGLWGHTVASVLAADASETGDQAIRLIPWAEAPLARHEARLRLVIALDPAEAADRPEAEYPTLLRMSTAIDETVRSFVKSMTHVATNPECGHTIGGRPDDSGAIVLVVKTGDDGPVRVDLGPPALDSLVVHLCRRWARCGVRANAVRYFANSPTDEPDLALHLGWAIRWLLSGQSSYVVGSWLAVSPVGAIPMAPIPGPGRI